MANKNFEVKHGLSVGGTERITSAGAGSFTDLTLSGDLNITGDVNSVSVTDLDVTDKTITLGKGQTESNSGSSGIIIDGSNASMLWDESNGEFDFNNPLSIVNSIGGDTVLNLTGSYGSGNNVALLGFARSGGAVSGDIRYVDATTDMEIGTGTAHAFSLKTSGTRRMFISSSGDVGIGTATPASLLSLQGDAELLRLDGTANTTRTIFFRNTTAANPAQIHSDGSLKLRAEDSGTHMEFHTVNTERMRIDSSGRVGIGTSSPSAPLHVVGNSYVQSGTLFTDAITAYSGSSISINAGSSHLAATVNGSERMRIDSSGNLGIGTTSPTEKLHVEGSVVIDAFSGGGETGIFFREGFSSSNKYNHSILAYDHDGSSADGISINAYDGVSFCTGSNSRQERMRIDSSGNVLIGTTSSPFPNGTGLAVNSSGTISRLILQNSSTGTGTTDGMRIGAIGTNLEIENVENGNIEFYNNGSERMRIDSGGDLLVGSSTNLDVLTSSPKIQVGSGSGHSSMQFYSGTGSVGALYFGDGTSGTDRYPGYIEYRHNNNTMAFRVNGTDHVVFLSNGQISCKNITATDSAGNVSIGYGALNVVQANSGDANVAVGYEALEDITTGSNNTGLGYRAGMNVLNGNYNVALGTFSMYTNTSGSRNTALGYQALYSASGNDHNTAVGNRALVTAGNNGSCTAVGSMALQACADNGHNNTAIGVRASLSTTSGQYNTSLGVDALEDNATGQYNTACGSNALGNVTGSNNSALGYSAGKAGSPGGQLVGVSNRIVLGNGDITHLYCETSSISTSDERDKTDFTDLNIGLDFVKSLKPYTFRWDKRHKYVDWDLNPDTDLNSITNDGTHKDAQLDLGFKAQEVEALEVAAGYKKEDETNLVIDLTNDGTKYGIKYEKLVPILVKAIQELEARVKELEG
tara:strand:+ start:2649 stop:5411 length:2763 start_codon:yes stop_codon:yes gene_type:complete